jgi:hypothetical protein
MGTNFVNTFGAGYRLVELRTQLSTKQLAAELGVTPRSVLRYIASETQSGKQSRSMSGKVRSAVNAIGRKLFAPSGGVHVQLDGFIAVEGEGEDYVRDRTIDLNLTEEQWDAITTAAQAGDESAASQAFADAYGVSELHIEQASVTLS